MINTSKFRQEKNETGRFTIYEVRVKMIDTIIIKSRRFRYRRLHRVKLQI